MNQAWRRVCAAVNPVSTAAARGWCLSGVRHMLTGYGPTGQQRQLIRDRRRRTAASTLSAEQNKVRAQMLDELPGRDVIAEFLPPENGGGS
jgi:hypothetical protein